MTAAGWITMVVVLGVAWGGFAWTLSLAIRREADKKRGQAAAAREEVR